MRKSYRYRFSGPGYAYVDSRLADDELYFEETGWADGFLAAKDEGVRVRDAQARAAQTRPKLPSLYRNVAVCGAVALASAAGWALGPGPVYTGL